MPDMKIQLPVEETGSRDLAGSKCPPYSTFMSHFNSELLLTGNLVGIQGNFFPLLHHLRLNSLTVE